MSRVCTLVALTAAALLGSAGRASAAHVTAPAPARAREGVNAVTGVSIVPSSGRAEVIIATSGPVDVSDFVLTGPDRVVIDLSGARLSMPPHMYDKVTRAGITNVYYESPGTAHEWLTWRRTFREFAPRLFR